MYFIIPKFKEIFLGFGIDLPAITVLLITISDIVVTYFYLIPAIPFAFILMLKIIRKNKTGAYVTDWMALKIPILGLILKKSTTARTCRTLGTLIASGVPILEALSISRDTAGNHVFRNAFDHIYAAIREGESMAVPLKETGIVDDIVVNMVDVGEETGALDNMLYKVADVYEEGSGSPRRRFDQHARTDHGGGPRSDRRFHCHRVVLSTDSADERSELECPEFRGQSPGGCDEVFSISRSQTGDLTSIKYAGCVRDIITKTSHWPLITGHSQETVMHRSNRMHPNQNRRHSGFTLIELLVAIGIVAILAGLLLSGIGGATTTVNKAQAAQELRNLETALASFHSEFGMYPPSAITLHEAPAGWAGDPRSRNLIQKLWPSFDFTITRNIDSDNSTDVSIDLNGAECLAFFLGGISTEWYADRFR